MKIKDMFFKLWFVNGVLFSALIIFVLVFIVYSFIPKKRHEDPGVKIISEKNPEEDNIEKSFDLYRIKSNNEYIYIPIYTNAVTIKSDSIDKSFSANKLYSGGYSEQRKKICNIKIINKETAKNRQLFDNDLFIKTMILSKGSEQSKNVFLVIIEDSNNDGYLNIDDETIVYVSDLDGTNLKKIASEISDIELIDYEYLILKPKLESDRVTYYNLDTGNSNYFTVDNLN